MKKAKVSIYLILIYLLLLVLPKLGCHYQESQNVKVTIRTTPNDCVQHN